MKRLFEPSSLGRHRRDCARPENGTAAAVDVAVDGLAVALREHKARKDRDAMTKKRTPPRKSNGQFRKRKT